MHDEMIRWALGGALILLGLLSGRLLRRFTAWARDKLAPFAPRWLVILGEGFARPLAWLLRLALLGCGVLLLPLPGVRERLLPLIHPLLRTGLTLLLFWGLWRASPICQLLLTGAARSMDLPSGQTISRFFENIYKSLVALFAALSCLDLLGLPVGSLIAGAGVAGLAVSLAAQSTLSNLIAGVTLVLEKPFGIGDYVALGSVEGTVEDISFRSTRLRTPDNVRITVENAKVCAEYIHNCTARTSRLWAFDLRLSSDESPAAIARAAEAVEAVLCSEEKVQPGSVQAIVENFDPPAAVINVRCYLDTSDFTVYRALKHRLNLRILDALRQADCRFALPAARVYMDDEERKE